MDQLTNLYKHKCEQLQEQIYNLTRMLNEAGGPPRFGGIPRFILPAIEEIGVVTSMRWRDLLSLAQRNSPSQMEALLKRYWGDEAFVEFWNANFGLLKGVGGVYQKLFNGKVWGWVEELHQWIPLNKPGYQSHFGEIGADGVLVSPTRWNLPFINPLHSPPPAKPLPPPPPPPPPPDMNPGWIPLN